MLKYIVFLAFSVLVASEEATPRVFMPVHTHIAPSRGRIIGGDESGPHSVPYQVAVHINYGSYCGGALISPNYVLTAGHCGIVIWVADVILGAHNLSNPNEATQVRIPVQRTIIHEGYNDDNYLNDIALLQLSSPAPLNNYIQTAILPPRQDISRSYQSEVATATGWGLPRDVPFPSTLDMSDVLLKVDVSVSNFTECAIYYNDDEDTYVRETNICTSGYRNKGTCNGDSGGPLTLNEVVIGLTSFGTTLCEVCSPSVYTRLVNYLDWISENSDVKV